ncbi:MAG: putative DNA-binding domain-containing protein [Burkholderiales bacterium]|nr:putative DNA-binding domain-containing protein [Burkholderiales bacterium]
MSDFYDYVRGRTDAIPAGYTEPGMRAYRYLVYLGASQMVEAHFPEVKSELGDEAWRTLIEAFVRQSQWTSNYYGDLKDEFLTFLARESA